MQRLLRAGGEAAHCASRQSPALGRFPPQHPGSCDAASQWPAFAHLQRRCQSNSSSAPPGSRAPPTSTSSSGGPRAAGAGVGARPPAQESSADPNFTLDGLVGSSSGSDGESRSRQKKQGSSSGSGFNPRAGPARGGGADGIGAADLMGQDEIPVWDVDEESDDEVAKARLELRRAMEEERIKAAEAVVLPTPMAAVVDKQGGAMPLDTDDEAHMPFLQSGFLNEADTRRTAKALAYHARMVRSVNDPEDLDLYAQALANELGSDLELEDPLAGGREADYAVGKDPLLDSGVALPFSVNALRFTAHMNWSAAPGKAQLDRRAVLSCYVRDLKLDAQVSHYVKAIANSHYNPRTDELRISIDKHPESGLNKRETLEQLVATIQTAQSLAKRHGPFKKQNIFPRYEFA